MKKRNIKLIWKRAENISEEEAQRKLEFAFDVLFNEVDRRDQLDVRRSQ